jgi:hypothetical protein
VVRIAIGVWLSAALALAADTAGILAAKLRTGHEAYRCVLQGTVTMLLSPQEYYIQDDTGGVRVNSPAYSLHPGDRLEVDGWMYLGDGGEFQMRATKVWYLAKGPPVSPRLIALPDAYAGAFQGQLVAVRGAVLNVAFGDSFDAVSIQHHRTSIRVIYPARQGKPSVFDRIYPGVEVAVTGVSVPQTADPEFDGYQVWLRSPADLAIRPAHGMEETVPQPWAEGVAALACTGAAAWMWTSRQNRRRRASQVQ